MSRHGLLTGLCAASLSVALLAGCSSPVVPPTTAPAADNSNQLTTTPVSDASTGAPVTAAPAAVTPATLNGKATFRGEALSGYTVSVLDAQTGKPVELRADLAGATGLAVLNQNLMTDANGAFSLQVVGLKAGQALRVLVSKGNATLETIVTSNLTVLGAKKYLVLDAGSADGLTVDELTTSIAKIARGVIRTARMLNDENAAAALLAKLSEQLNAISDKLDAALKANASLASSIIDGDKGDENVKALVKSAGVIADVNKTVAGLVAEIATNAKDKPVDANVASELSKIGFLGTDLDGALANGRITLTNRETGKSADATGDTSNVTNTNNSSNGGSHNNTVTEVTGAPALAFVTPQDFGVFTGGAVDGYSVGFNLAQGAASASKVEVSLYKGSTLLAKNVTTQLLTNYADAHELSSPFDIDASFTDPSNWTLGAWGGTALDVPNRAVIRVTSADGRTAYTVENNNLTGDASALVKTGLSALAVVEPQDFGVMTLSGVNGYNVGFSLKADMLTVDHMEVSLYNGSTLIATDTATNAQIVEDWMEYNTPPVSLSAPFNVDGPAQYEVSADGKDHFWTETKRNTDLAVVPTKAVIRIFGKNHNVYEVVNSTLSGDVADLSPIADSSKVLAQDFGVFTGSGVNGYSLGFQLGGGLTTSTVSGVYVSLYNGGKLLQKNRTNTLLSDYPGATTLSSPFDINGTFRGGTDTSWTQGAWLGDGVSEVPTRAVVQVFQSNGRSYKAEYGMPTGNPADLQPNVAVQ